MRFGAVSRARSSRRRLAVLLLRASRASLFISVEMPLAMDSVKQIRLMKGRAAGNEKRRRGRSARRGEVRAESSARWGWGLRGGGGFDGFGVPGGEDPCVLRRALEILAELFQAHGGIVRSERPHMVRHHEKLDEVYRWVVSVRHLYVGIPSKLSNETGTHTGELPLETIEKRFADLLLLFGGKWTLGHFHRVQLGLRHGGNEAAKPGKMLLEGDVLAASHVN